MSSNSRPEQSLRPPRRSLFIQLSGAPGSGKSTIARLLRQRIGAVVIDHDIIKSTLLVDDSISFDQAAKSTYRLDWALAESMIKQDWSVIIDSTCHYQEILCEGMKLAELYGYDYWYIECRVDNISLLDERLLKRVPLRSQRPSVDCPPLDARAAGYSEDPRALFARWIENLYRPEEGGMANVVTVDSSRSLEECRDYILEQMFSSCLH